jgi:hypothetical protein
MPHITLTRGVSHCDLAIYIKKYLKAKEESITGTQIFHHAKNIIFQKNPVKKTKIVQDITTL